MAIPTMVIVECPHCKGSFAFKPKDVPRRCTDCRYIVLNWHLLGPTELSRSDNKFLRGLGATMNEPLAEVEPINKESA